MIAIIDYGMGNLRSVSKALEHLGAECRLCRTGRSLKGASRIILPGVGAFGDAMKELEARGFAAPIKYSLEKGAKLLGVCLGLQLLFDSSEEAKGTPGLGILPGKVLRFRSPKVKVPHMGWNDVRVLTRHPLLKGIRTGDYFYFVHSFYAKPKTARLALANCKYGAQVFAAIVGNERIAATQFHPEKSQDAGLRLLRNFISW